MKDRVITKAKDLEIWRSAIPGWVVLRRFDRKGDVVSEIVRGGAQVLLSPEERQYNQQIVVEDSLDPFLNGMLVPVKLVDSAEDYEELKGNPNHLTDEDMRELLSDHENFDALSETLQSLNNVATLQRFMAIAYEPQLNTLLAQVRMIEDRIETIQEEAMLAQMPDPNATEAVMQTSQGRSVVGTTAPLSPAPVNPGMGRRKTVR